MMCTACSYDEYDELLDVSVKQDFIELEGCFVRKSYQSQVTYNVKLYACPICGTVTYDDYDQKIF